MLCWLCVVCENLCIRADVAVELATVSMVDGKLEYKILDNATVDTALKELDLAQPSAESS